MSPVELAYAAGLFDGEGTIMVRARTMKGCRSLNHSLIVKVTNTNLDVLTWLAARWPANISKTGPSDHPGWRQAYSWALNNRRAAAFLEDIEPHLVIKKREAEIAMQLQARIVATPRGLPLEPTEVEAREALRQEILDQPGRRTKSR